MAIMNDKPPISEVPSSVARWKFGVGRRAEEVAIFEEGPPPLRWTSDPPNEPGWYWIQTSLTSFPEMIEVVSSGYGWVGLHLATGVARFSECAREYQTAKWAGPIPLPVGSEPMTSKERAATVRPEEYTDARSFRDAVSRYIREAAARDNLLDEAVGTLADIAFSEDLDLVATKKKAAYHYFKVRLETDPDDEDIQAGCRQLGIRARKDG